MPEGSWSPRAAPGALRGAAGALSQVPSAGGLAAGARPPHTRPGGEGGSSLFVPRSWTALTELGRVFVGRRAELDRIAAAVAHPDLAGAALVGESGAGKSRLLTEVIRAAPASTFVIRACAIRATAEVPFGAFAQYLPPPLMDTAFSGNVLRMAADALIGQAGGRDLLIVVDDAHLLDEASVALTFQMARHREAFVLAAYRAGEAVPEPIAGLWSGGLAEWIEVPPFTRDEVARLLEGTLGGPVEGLLVQRAYETTRGNAFLLRELITAMLETGALAPGEGVWRGPERLPVTARLAGLVGKRLEGLPPECHRVLELLAFGEPLGTGILAGLVSHGAVETVESRGVIRIDQPGLARLAYPFYGEVLRARAPRLRAHRCREELADALEAADPSREARRRVVAWRLENGVQPSPRTLAAAARDAWAHRDLPMSRRLAAHAVSAGLAQETAEPFGYTLFFAGHPHEAESHLSRLTTPRAADRDGGDEEWARAVGARAFNLYFGLGRGPEARAVIRTALRDVPLPRPTAPSEPPGAGSRSGGLGGSPGAGARSGEPGGSSGVAGAPSGVPGDLPGVDDARLARSGGLLGVDGHRPVAGEGGGAASCEGRAEMEALRALFTVFGGDCAEGLRLAGEAAAGTGRGSRARAVAETVRAVALAFLGRGEDALAALGTARELSLRWAAELPWMEVFTGFASVHACLLDGRFAEAEARAADAYDRAVARRCQFAVAWACLGRALAAGACGDTREQVNRCREGIAITRDRRDRGLRAVLLGRLAHALALSGDPSGAAACLAESDHLAQRTLWLLQPWTELARAWAAAGRRSPHAAVTAEQAATLARASGATTLEALALHDTTRIATVVPEASPGAAPRARRRLADLAARDEDGVVRLYAAHADAVAAGDGAALGECSECLEHMGSPLLAAEAAAEEAARRRASGDLTAACAAAARALRLAEGTGARSPVLAALERPHLTRRELQIAALAADGMSSREISTHFVLSVRTVENHLQRTYRKLGIGDRSELAALRGLFLQPEHDAPDQGLRREKI